MGYIRFKVQPTGLLTLIEVIIPCQHKSLEGKRSKIIHECGTLSHGEPSLEEGCSLVFKLRTIPQDQIASFFFFFLVSAESYKLSH
jgi:hypothetical protein